MPGIGRPKGAVREHLERWIAEKYPDRTAVIELPEFVKEVRRELSRAAPHGEIVDFEQAAIDAAWTRAVQVATKSQKYNIHGGGGSKSSSGVALAIPRDFQTRNEAISKGQEDYIRGHDDIVSTDERLYDDLLHIRCERGRCGHKEAEHVLRRTCSSKDCACKSYVGLTEDQAKAVVLAVRLTAVGF